jgi:hypothetical protein
MVLGGLELNGRNIIVRIIRSVVGGELAPSGEAEPVETEIVVETDAEELESTRQIQLGILRKRKPAPPPSLNLL